MKQIKLIAFLMLLFSAGAFAQKNHWQPVTAARNSATVLQNKQNLTQPKLFVLDIKSLKTELANTAKRNGKLSSNTIITFPDANGKYENFSVVESSNMDPVLAAKYPDIKSYVGKGIKDPTSLIYFSVSPLGLQTMLLRPDKPVVLIEPYTTDRSTYTVYNKGDRTSFTKLECKTIDKGIDAKTLRGLTGRPNADDGTLRTFRIVLSATGEYTAYFGGTKAQALAAINNTLTRVNGIFETDFAVHFNLVANNDNVIYTDAATDPYSDVITNQEVQTTLTNNIGDANYDIGEAFGTQNQGGNAACVGCVCVNPADANAPDQAKGSGFTTLPEPAGDIFDIDFLCHEIGHTLGANHTFTYQPGLEGTIAQVEAGSGTTIMSYAGYTGATDILPHPYPYFHAISIQQATDNIKTKTCSVNTPTGNAIPTANAGPDHTIPKGTPFILTGAATDANDASLLYNWEEIDLETEANTPYPSVTDVTGPEFRNFNLSSSNARTFPELTTVLAGATSSTWEAVPNVARDLTFRFTVRDNHAGGSANNSDDVIVTTDAASGPFVVTSPNTAVTLTGGTVQTITWNVANSTAPPVSTTNVKISLSTDGGFTFPTVLLASTPNDGSQVVTIPTVITTTARIKVEAVDNIFFDISNANFSINTTTACTKPTLSEVVSNITCKGSSTGAINLTTTGGSSPFTYAWTGPNGFTATSQDISGLKAGAYTVKVKATGGCIASGTYTLRESASALSVSATVTQTIACNGGKASVAVSASGGTGPYTGTGTKTNQTAGSHTYTVTDSKGCSVSKTITISQPSPLVVYAAYKAILCAGGKTTVLVYISGGTPPFTGTGEKTNQAAGSHTYTVTDAKGCTSSKTINIAPGNGTPPDAPYSITGTSTATAGQSNVQYSVTAITDVTYTWVVPSGATITSGQGSNVIKVKFGSSSGYVKVTASTVCGSSSQKTKYVNVGTPTISKSAAAPDQTISNELSLSVFPNPVQDIATVVFSAQKKNDKFELRVTDAHGKTLAVQSGLTVKGDNKVQVPMGKYTSAIYLVTLFTDNKIQTQKLVKTK